MCDFPICCRDNGAGEEEVEDSNKAGYWGDYRCDMPIHTMQNFFDFIKNNVVEMEIDFITWLGDNGAHAVYDYSKEEVAEYSSVITKALK